MFQYRISVVVLVLALLAVAPRQALAGEPPAKRGAGENDLRGVVKDKGKSWEQRVTAAEALGKQGTKAAVPEIGDLLKELTQPSADLGKVALVKRTVKALGALGPAATPAVDVLAKASQLRASVIDLKTGKERNGWEEVNVAAISALGKNGSPKAIAELRSHLGKDGDSVHRVAAISALEGVALTGGTKARNDVLVMLRVTAATDADLDVRRIAKDAIKKIETKFPKKR